MNKKLIIVFFILLFFLIGLVYYKNTKPVNSFNGVVVYEQIFITKEKLWETVNNWRASQNLPVYQESEFLCGIAKIRLTEVQINFSHNGFSADRFCIEKKCTISENLSKGIYLNNNFSSGEEAVLEGWLSSPPHAGALKANFSHSCIATDGLTTVQIFGYY